MIEYRSIRIGRFRWWVAEDQVPLFLSGPFRDLDALLEQGRVLKDLRGKKTVECSVGEDRYLVKIHKPGGLWRRWKTLVLGSRVRRELRRSLEVTRRGQPTVFLTAVGVRGTEEFVVTEKLPGWESLESVLLGEDLDAEARRRTVFAYGQFARDLHDAGIWQYDFNASNVLVNRLSDVPDFKVIDFERMRFRRSLSEDARLRSLAKLNRISRLSRTDRLRFLLGYVTNHPQERYRLAEIAAEIRQHHARQLERDAERLARNCVEENRNFGAIRSDRYTGFYRRRRPEHPAIGLTSEDLTALLEGSRNGVRVEASERALERWQRANVESRSGGPTPAAVLVERGRTRGSILFLS